MFMLQYFRVFEPEGYIPNTKQKFSVVINNI